MNNLKIWTNKAKIWGKQGLLLAFALIISVSLLSCPQPGGTGAPGKPGNSGLRVLAMDVSGETEWDYMFLRSDGVSMFVNVNKETDKPTSMYVITDKEEPENGIAMTFKENGLPDLMMADGHILYFGNFNDGYTFDLAIIKPNGETEYHYNIQTDTNFDTYGERSVSGVRRSASTARSIEFEDVVGWKAFEGTWVEFDIYDAASFALGLGTCVAAVWCPVLAPRCIGWAIGTVAQFASTVLTDIFIADEDDKAVVSSTISLVIDSLDCLTGGWGYECVTGLTGVAHTIFNFVTGVYDDDAVSEAMATIEPDPTPYVFFDVKPNGSSQSTTTKLTLTFKNVNLSEFSINSADEITLTANRTGIVKGGLTKVSDSVYELAVSGITGSGFVKVGLYKYGYRAFDEQVRVFAPSRPLTFSVTADGSPDVTTSKLTLSFGTDIDLIPGDITLDAGSTRAAIEKLISEGDGVYELLVKNIFETGTVTVSVSLSYFNTDYFFIGPSSREVTVYKNPNEFVLTPMTITNGGFSAIGYGGGKFIIVPFGYNNAGDAGCGYIHSSVDGTAWEQGVHNNTFGTNKLIRAIGYGDGKFIAVGDSGGMTWSTTGITWVTVGTSTFGSTGIGAITYGGGRFVAGGQSGKMAWSTDGENWTAVETSTFGTTGISAIAWGNGKFVAGGANGKMAWSTDGENWTAVTDSTFGTSDNEIRTIAYGNGKFVVGGGYSIKMAWSTDGVTWTAVTSHPFSGSSSSSIKIAWGNGKFIAGGVGGKMARSTDGVTWTAITDHPFGTDGIAGIAYGNDMFIAMTSAYSKSQTAWSR
ncbi:MAG: hypothetical protein LBB89_09600 [Treponema sp.]|jgi:hypothetical protein|nr:hypothetical protein [Treponema sp.]